MTGMKAVVHLGSRVGVQDPVLLRDVVQAAEDLGYDAVQIGDHPLPPSKIAADSSTRVHGTVEDYTPYTSQPWLDPGAALGFIAASTSRIRIGTGVLIAPYRHPALVAKLISTLDQLSAGRAYCGIGVGWLREEFDLLRVPFAERAAMTDEAAQVLRLLWEQPVGTFNGRYFPIDREVNATPRPVQGHVPLWFGGNTYATLRRVIRWGDGWMPLGLLPAETGRRVEWLHREARDAGRSPEALEVVVPVPYPVSPETIAGYAANGVTALALPVTGSDSRKLTRQLEDMAELVGAA
jgi:probable F420-dependent oxidoreductase